MVAATLTGSPIGSAHGFQLLHVLTNACLVLLLGSSHPTRWEVVVFSLVTNSQCSAKAAAGCRCGGQELVARRGYDPVIC